MNLKCKLGIHDYGISGKYKIRKCYKCGAEVKRYDRRKTTYISLIVLQVLVIIYLFQMIGIVNSAIASIVLYLFSILGEERKLYKKVKE